MMDTSMILDHWPWWIYFCIQDVYIYDPWSWCMCMMHVCMMHVCMMHIYTILDPDYDWYIYDSWSLTLMHIFLYPYIYDPWSWCMCVWYLCVWCIYLLSLTLIMMDTSMILDPWPWCKYFCIHDAYIYDPWSWCMCVWCGYERCVSPWSLTLIYVSMMRGFFVTDGRTNEQGNSRSWMTGGTPEVRSDKS